jgi:hypothetical protein
MVAVCREVKIQVKVFYYGKEEVIEPISLSHDGDFMWGNSLNTFW